MVVCERNFVCAQDNAKPHTARDMIAFLAQQGVEIIDWPARSPGLNPIEHIWDQMGVWIWDMYEPASIVTTHLLSIECADWSK